MFPRQHYEVRVLTAPNAHGAPGSQLLFGMTGGPEAETQAREIYQRASRHMLDGNTVEWFTTFWTRVQLLGPNGHIEAVERPAPAQEGPEA